MDIFLTHISVEIARYYISKLQKYDFPFVLHFLFNSTCEMGQLYIYQVKLPLSKLDFENAFWIALLFRHFATIYLIVVRFI